MNRPFRVLIWHDESDCLFEVGDPLLADSCLSNGETDDVTDIPVWEERLKLQKEGVNWRDLI